LLRARSRTITSWPDHVRLEESSFVRFASTNRKESGPSPERDHRAAERLSLLQSLTAALARARTCEQVAGVIIDQALPALGAEVGVVAVVTDDGRSLRNVGFKGVTAATEEAWREYPLESPVPVAEAALTRKPIIVSTIEERNRRYPVLADVHGLEHGGAVTTFPLIVDGTLLGALGFCFCGPCDFDADDLAFLNALADHCALAVERARLHDLAEHEIQVRTRSEELLRDANRRKDEFLAMLAHELRNPLAPIRTAAQLLHHLEVKDPRVERVRDVIERQSAHMSRIVDDLLDVSRITRGSLLLRKSRLDLVELVRATLGDHRPSLDAAGLTVELSLPDAPVWIMADATRISQAIANLVHNAQKFTERGGAVQVRLGVDAESATLSVVDTGIGMDATTVQHVFETFSQADRTLARSRGGLGLGLSLVKGLVELHDGAVSASSPGLGRGSVFSIRLPLDRAASVKPAATTAATAHRRRVLVIEDNVDAAEMLQMMLELAGHEVALAHDGDDGVVLAERWKPDVVLSDIGLPGTIDGYGVARALRRKASSNLLLVALSGYGQEQDKERARAAGFDAHMTKPVDAHALIRLLAAPLAAP
jgi:signal transduction histidine kinase/ActR/RegA family two-component response regulator